MAASDYLAFPSQQISPWAEELLELIKRNYSKHSHTRHLVEIVRNRVPSTGWGQNDWQNIRQGLALEIEVGVKMLCHALQYQKGNNRHKRSRRSNDFETTLYIEDANDKVG